MVGLLVTGGCGFIGSNFIHYLLDEAPEVTVVNFDSLTYAGNLANLEDVAGHSRYRFIHADITNREAARAAVKNGIPRIINLSAGSQFDRHNPYHRPFL